MIVVRALATTLALSAALLLAVAYIGWPLVVAERSGNYWWLLVLIPEVVFPVALGLEAEHNGDESPGGE